MQQAHEAAVIPGDLEEESETASKRGKKSKQTSKETFPRKSLIYRSSSPSQSC